MSKAKEPTYEDLMNFGIIKKMFAIILLLLAGGAIQGQDNFDCYEYITFKTFLNSKIKNDTNFVKQIYGNITYPNIAKKQEVEGKVEVMLINHKDKKFEVILLNNPVLFNGIENQIYAALDNLEINQEHPFVTRFNVVFSINEFRYPREAYEKFHLGLYNDDTFSFLIYLVPMIDRN